MKKKLRLINKPYLRLTMPIVILLGLLLLCETGISASNNSSSSQSSTASASAQSYTTPNDWPKFQHDAQHTGFDSYNGIFSPPLVKKWEHNLSYNNSHNQPIVVNDTVYLGYSYVYGVPGETTVGGGIEAFDVETGNLKWIFESDGRHYVPSFADGTIYSSADNGKVYALDANNGELKWSFDSGSEFGAPLTVYKGRVFAGTSSFGAGTNSYLYAINAKSGNLEWTFRSSLENTGFACPPAASQNTLYFSAGNLYALKTETGAIKWQSEVGSNTPQTPSVVDGVVYIRDLYSLNAFNSSNGSLLWSVPTGETRRSSAPSVAYGNVYYLDWGDNINVSSQSLICVDAVTGQEKWRYFLGCTDQSSIAIANGFAVVGFVHDLDYLPSTAEAKLYVLDAFNGTYQWSYDTKPTKGSNPSPVIVGDKICANIDKYTFAVFEPPPEPEPPTTPEGYFQGDSHVHSIYSGDVPWFLGKNINELKNEAISQNLSWIAITDHSDFVTSLLAFYIWDILEQEEWNYRKSDILSIAQDYPIIEGEEATMRKGGTDLTTTGHFIAFIDDLVTTLQLIDDEFLSFSEQELLNSIKRKSNALGNNKGFGFIAHPYGPADEWQNWNLILNNIDVIKGIELFSTNKWGKIQMPSRDLINRWDYYLGIGTPFYAIGNSDYSGYDLGLKTIGEIGAAKTYIRQPPSSTIVGQKAEILDALKKGHSIVSNGPFLEVSIDNKGPGESVKKNEKTLVDINYSWDSASSHDNEIEILFGNPIDLYTTPIMSLEQVASSGSGTKSYEINEDGYIRVALYHRSGNRIIGSAFSNPIWIDVPGAVEYPPEWYSSEPSANSIYVVYPDQTETQTYTVTPETRQLKYIISWPGSDVQLTLVDPDGNLIDSSTTDYDITHEETTTSESFIIDNPTSGDWQVKMTGVDVPPEGEDVTLDISGVVDTPPEVTISQPADEDVVSGTVNINAQATDPEGITDFHLSLNGEELATSADNSTISHSWNSTQVRDGKHFISAMATDVKNTPGQEGINLIVDNYPPYAETGPDQFIKPEEEVFFSASGSQDVSQLGYTWDFSDGNIEEYMGPTISHIYENPGTYTVTLTVEDDAGNTDTDTITVVVDGTPPAGTIVINGDATHTDSTSVTLDLLAGDGDGSGVDEMRFSDDGANWTDWEYYDTEKEWTLNPPDGIKNVYAQFKDKSGNISDTCSDDITLDIYPSELAFINQSTSGNQSLWIYEAHTEVGGDIGTPSAIDWWIGNSSDDTNVILVTSADFDSDGDAELALVRQKTDGDQYLEIYEIPTTIGGDLGAPIATDTYIGNANGNINVVSLASGDFDNDDTPELAFVAQSTSGIQSLWLFEALQIIGDNLGQPIASDGWIANANGNVSVKTMTSGDFDNDGTSELAFVAQNTSGIQSLWLFEAPTTVGGDLGSPIASDGWIGNSKQSTNVTQISSGDFDSSNILPELALIRTNPTNSNQQLYIHNPPADVGGDMGLPIATDGWIGNANTDTFRYIMTSVNI